MRSKKKNTPLVLISVTALFVMLTLATACWQTADPATSPNEEVQASAHQGGASSTEKQAAPDQSGEPEVQTTSELEEYLAEHADVSIFDVMDEDTARLFSELPSDWQNERIEGWEQFKVDVSPDHWAEVLAWLVDNQHDLYTFTNRDETPSSEPPDGAQNETNWLPESVRMLAPVYHDTFRLLPDGPWARKFLALRFEEIESIDWERLKASYAGPYPTPTPELDLGEEFQLSRALLDAGANDEEWLIGKVRSIDADAARQFEATQDVTERLETLRRLVEVEGKEQGVLEIEMEWQMRLAEWSEVEIARFLERQRNSVALSEARRQWTPDEQYRGYAESLVCNSVMSYVVGENPGVYRPDGRCDIAKVIVMSKEALDARDGQDLYSEDDFREMAEFALQNPGQWLHVSPASAAQATKSDTSSPNADTPTEADLLVSTLGFIRVGLDGKDAYNVYPPGVHESCVSPAPGHPPPAAKMEVGSPPVPAYLPEGVSLDQESHAPDGTHIGNIYAGKGGANSGVRVTVRHGVCESVTVRTPSDKGDSSELTSVEGNWGIFFHEDADIILNLTLETENGFVEIRSIDLQAKQRNRIGKDELIKIAESMPIFGGEAVSVAKP